MKKLFLIFILTTSVVLCQNATQYLPTKLGNTWIFLQQALDSLSNPVGPITQGKTISLAYDMFLGKQTLITLSGINSAPAIDTGWLAPSGTHVYTHQAELKFDSINIGASLPDWLDLYRLANTINASYTVYQIDTTVTIDSTSLPLRIKLIGKKLANENVTVPAGTFNNCLKFELAIAVQLRVIPVPPIYVDLFTIKENQWIADSTWIVKTFRGTVDFTIPTTTRTIRIPGLIKELSYFGPYYCGSIPYSEGWNLLSIPLIGSNMTKTSIFPTATSQAFAYQNGYVQADTLKLGNGYWIKFSQAGSQNFCGLKAYQNSVNVKAGWNLIGPYSKVLPVSGITSTPPGIISSNFFAYNAGYIVADSLRPSRGYWVKCNLDGQLGISSLVKPEKPENNNNSNVTTIEITDNEERTNYLYLSDDSRTVNFSSLPPVPPAGIFDCRFSSDRFIETTDNSNKIILLNSASYPVKIRMSGSKILLFDEKTNKNLSLNAHESGTIIISDPTIQSLIVKQTFSPKDYQLEQNYPNPFNPATHISFAIPENSNVILSIFNTLGQKVLTVIDGQLETGTYKELVDMSAFPSGLYIYQLKIKNSQNNRLFTKKMLLIK